MSLHTFAELPPIPCSQPSNWSTCSLDQQSLSNTSSQYQLFLAFTPPVVQSDELYHFLIRIFL